MAKKILVVDDSLTMRQLVRVTLSRSGYEIAEAEDGAKGLERAKTNQFDLVLSDVNMPGLTGIELVKSLRALPDYRFTPIVLITTESEVTKKQEGKQAGATGWIVKPFDPTQLITVVAKVLR